MIPFLSYLGGLSVIVCALTGAYPWLRWGFCGVTFLWKHRGVIDEAVRDEIRETYKGAI